MHPVLSSPARLGKTALLWAPLVAGLVVLHQGVTHLPWAASLVLVAPAAVVELFFLLATGYVCLAIPMESREIARLFVLHTLSAALMTALWVAAFLFYGQALDRLSGSAGWSGRCRDLVPFQVALGLILYSLACLSNYLVMVADRARQAERVILERELQLARTEVRALRALIHPHFLFNSLNALAALTRSDPAQARDVCLRLADFLRYSLRHGQQDWVSLGEELDHMEAYLAIERVRLGERLAVEWEVEPAAREVSVPALLLLPLLENAVKHGIQQRLAGGTVRLAGKLASGTLEIVVVNPRESPVGAPGAGFGLPALRQRLALLYGERANLSTRMEEDRFIACLQLPVAGPSAAPAAAPPREV